MFNSGQNESAVRALPLVSIITVNFNQASLTCDLLNSIRKQDYRAVEVIVVDNGSAENPVDLLSERYPGLVFIRSERNLGFAGGNNLGIRAAKGAYLFLLNNDTELTPFCIGRLVAFLQQHPDCGAVSPLLCYYKTEGEEGPDHIQYAGMTRVSPFTARNKTLGAGLPDAGQFLSASPTAYTHGAAMMVPAAVVRQVGLMPEVYFLYYEELDWCEQIRRAGFGVWVEPSARVYHKESATVSQMGALKSYFMHRNRLLFVQRNYPATAFFFYTYMWMVVTPKSILAAWKNREKDALHSLFKALFFFFFGVRNEFETLLVGKA